MSHSNTTIAEHMPNMEAVDRLLETLKYILSGLRASGAKIHSAALPYENLRLAKESFGKKPDQYAQVLIRCMSKASQFIAGYRANVTR